MYWSVSQNIIFSLWCSSGLRKGASGRCATIRRVKDRFFRLHHVFYPCLKVFGLLYRQDRDYHEAIIEAIRVAPGYARVRLVKKWFSLLQLQCPSHATCPAHAGVSQAVKCYRQAGSGKEGRMSTIDRSIIGDRRNSFQTQLVETWVSLIEATFWQIPSLPETIKLQPPRKTDKKAKGSKERNSLNPKQQAKQNDTTDP